MGSWRLLLGLLQDFLLQVQGWTRKLNMKWKLWPQAIYIRDGVRALRL